MSDKSSIEWAERCGPCSGDGWTVEAVHACGGDERRCAVECPVEEQVQCGHCGGSGRFTSVREMPR